MIDDETAKYLKENSSKPGRFYTIPKIYKQGHPGRPMVSNNSHPIERISQFFDHHLQPLVTKLPSYIKDTTHFLNKLNSIGQLPNGVLLVTLDVASLYTNILHNDGIQACSDSLDKRVNPTIKTTRLCDLIRMILTNNTFTFNGQRYRQINGTAMETKMASSYTNLFMGNFEQKALAAATQPPPPPPPPIWWRYIDDIFLLWTHGEEKLNDFITYLNNLHPTIKFTSSFSYNEIPFLDVKVMLLNGRLETYLYVKPTDKHQYLLKSSCHPSHTKQSIPFSMALRLRRICSTDEFFNARSDALTSHLIKRGYKYRFIKDEIDKVRQIRGGGGGGGCVRSRALKTSTKKESNRIPFVVTFNPALPNIRQVISSNLNILRSSQRCPAAFPSPPLISYRRCSNLSDILVRAKHRRPPPLAPRSFRCNRRRCKTCRFIKEGTTSYTFFATNGQKGIRHHITCSSSNLVYMIQCTKCRIQYIGDTKHRLSDRFGEHRRAIEKAITQRDIDQPTAVSDHFTLPSHSLKNLELIPLELINSNRDAIRKAREAFLIYKGKTLEPSGMNRRDKI